MFYLLLSILSSAAIVVIFKYIDKYAVNTFNAIIINYFVAVSIGFALNNTSLATIFSSHDHSWIILACIIGLAFIAVFYVIGKTVQNVGVSVTSVAGKMSVIIPMLFSILYYQEDIYILKIAGIVIALFAVGFTIIKKQSGRINKKFIYLPVVLFMGSGFVDSSLKLAQQDFIEEGMLPVFSVILFAAAALFGILLMVFARRSFGGLLAPKVLFFGILLGIANFGSFYFLINALTFARLDSSIVYGINNIGIVTFTILYGLLMFKERLTSLNWVGIFLSFVAIWILSNA